MEVLPPVNNSTIEAGLIITPGADINGPAYRPLGKVHACFQAGYSRTTNALDNNKHSLNQQSGIWCKYLSGNNLPRIKPIRGKLLPDRNLLPMIAY